MSDMAANMYEAIDADFDSYWEEEARNPNRNRIRIGRQYQATVPPLLKHGESDGRKLEELETLRWRPDNELSDQQLDQYLSVAKAVSLFTRAIDNNLSPNSVATDSQIEADGTAHETNDNTNQNTNHDKSENHEKGDKTKDNLSASSTSAVKDNRIQSALKGLSEFVSSHHPIHRDVGCKAILLPETAANSGDNESTNSLTSLLSAEWNPNETKLFSRALEVCGKNFSAIKKDFLPWKSVKSIIEHYYLGIERAKHDEPKDHKDLTQSDSNIHIKQEPLGSNSLALDILSSVSKFMSSCADSKPELNDCQRTQSSHMSSEESNDCDVRVSDDSKTPAVSGQEVKPLKAKPILPSAIQESNNSVSTVGSLKFYLDGQLVLKLNAQQENNREKCQWVESSDIIKKARLMHKTKKRLLNDRPDLDANNHLNNKTSNNEDLEDVSNDSSDDESLESNESALVPSPSAMVAKKAKVKLENNSHKSLSSPTTVLSKDPKLDVPSNSCNRIDRKVDLINNIKREHLSPNSLVSEDDSRKKLADASSERPNSQNCLENKWYHTIVEKSSLHPPKAHSLGSSVPSHRHSRYESVQSSLGSSSTTSSPSSSSSSTSGAPVPSVSSNAIPVDLTRKSINYSPFETKSSQSLSSASTPDFGSYPERDKNSKMLSSPSPPRPPFVFPYPAYSLSPTQSQSKIKREKEVKSSSNMCQKPVEGRPIKSSPPSSPSSVASSHSSTSPVPYPSPGQLAWLQNAYSPYHPIYEQYYRYYYGYGMPPPTHPQFPMGERMPSSQIPRESEQNNKERAKCLAGRVLADGEDQSCGS